MNSSKKGQNSSKYPVLPYILGLFVVVVVLVLWSYLAENKLEHGNAAAQAGEYTAEIDPENSVYTNINHIF